MAEKSSEEIYIQGLTGEVLKGQLISEWLFDVSNFPKNNVKIWWISALESKKWLNQKDKGALLCKIAPYW